ncbi:MAG: HDIG domain-containing metalloprotein, partial [Planctomycetota bacterium]
MSKIKPNPSRRREIRKNIPRREVTLRSWLSRSQVLWGLFYVVIFVGAASWLEWQRSLEPAYRVGQVVDKTHVARVAFQSTNLQATEQARESARAKAPAVYVPNALWFETIENLLAKLPEVAASVSDADQIPADSLAVGLNADALAGLRVYHGEEGVSKEWVELVQGFVYELRRKAILDTVRYLAERENLAPTIMIQVSEDRPLYRYDNDLLNVGDIEQMSELVEELGSGFGAGVRARLLGYLTDEATRGANYALDADATAEAKEAEAGKVEAIITSFESGQTMVVAGEPLDEDRYRLLQHENQAYLAWLNKEGQKSMGVLHRLGGVGLIGLVALGLVVCVVALRPRVAQNPMRGLALCTLLLGALAMAQALSPYSQTVGSVGMAMLVVVILTIAYDQRFALAVGGLEVMMIALLMHLSIGSVMVMLAACFVAVMQLREVRQRGALIRMGFVTGVVVALGVGAAGYWERQLVEGVGTLIAFEAWYGFLVSMGVGFFVLGVLPYIEKVFKVTTAMTLVELCDVNQPLLRRLQQVAPGTYNHSLLVGTLAESAAEAIGADSLLTRVGAYYHDIGK